MFGGTRSRQLPSNKLKCSCLSDVFRALWTPEGPPGDRGLQSHQNTVDRDLQVPRLEL